MIFNWGRKKQKDAAPADAATTAEAEAPALPADAAEAAASAMAVEAAPTSADAQSPDAAPALDAKPDTTPEPDPTPDSTEPAAGAVATEKAKKPGFFSRLTAGLRRSSSRLSDNVSALFTQRKLDDDALEELEDLLLAADLGAGPAGRVIARLAKDKFDKNVSDAEVRTAMADVVAETLSPHEADLDLSGARPQVVLFVGVNGAGKTTTLGKIAAMVKAQGRKAVLAAGDTFRAAAIEQLQVWGERTGCPVVARPLGSDAAGLAFEAYEKAVEEDADILLIDTAGRLQNKTELMEELRKIVRVLRKHDETAPHHSLLVLDATVGQNALAQAAAFREAGDVTGLIMTKLDGTAKGGVLVALADKHPDLPIYFTGVGESIEDLAPFSATAFAAALAGVEPAARALT